MIERYKPDKSKPAFDQLIDFTWDIWEQSMYEQQVNKIAKLEADRDYWRDQASLKDAEVTVLRELVRQGKDLLMGWSRIEDEVHWDEHNQITDEWLKQADEIVGGSDE